MATKKKMSAKQASPRKAAASGESRELKRTRAKLEKIQRLAHAILRVTGRGTDTPPPSTGL